MNRARRVSLVVYGIVAVVLLSGGLWALLTDQRGAVLWSLGLSSWVLAYLFVDSRLKRASQRNASESER
ncbi:hypothetical protein M3667_08720 [Microbacterium sp. P26]|uniref:hypothetical protein n=1 Tax=Microbacterium TaxID=33882 RepID=UPI00203CDEEB|nr:hypothetical protein [Microbacterium sp. P26]MCM3501952.1 hypothetical protein [Microbacterium sp. P26]